MAYDLSAVFRSPMRKMAGKSDANHKDQIVGVGGYSSGLVDPKP